jgi:Mannosyltransferase (PIG-V)
MRAQEDTTSHAVRLSAHVWNRRPRRAVIASVAADSGGDVAERAPRFEGLRNCLPTLRYCAGVYLSVRLALFALGAAAWALTDEHRYPLITVDHRVIPVRNGWHNAITGWLKQDAQHFLWIAKHGYSNRDTGAAFYPGYPLLTRLVSDVLLNHLVLAAYLVSNGALLAALVVFYRLTEDEYDEPAARRAVLYLCVFPTAFFLFDAYSESLFLLATVGAFALARRGHWVWAGLAGIAATLTRSVGVVIVLALAVEAVHQTTEGRRAAGPRGLRDRLARPAMRLGASVIPLAGIGSYLLFWQLRYHDWYWPLQVEQVIWNHHVSLPWTTLWRGMMTAAHDAPLAGQGWKAYDFVVVAVGLALGVWVAVRTRPVYAVYTWASILFFLCAVRSGRPLLSDPRFLVVIFPLFWPLAWLGRRSGGHEAVVALSAAALAIVSWLFLSTLEIY